MNYKFRKEIVGNDRERAASVKCLQITFEAGYTRETSAEKMVQAEKEELAEKRVHIQLSEVILRPYLKHERLWTV
jgi:hypothetical protein